MKYFLTVIRYGDDFRTMRRYMTQYFNSREHVSLYPLLKGQVILLLKNLLDEPERFEDHIDRRVSAASTYLLYLTVVLGQVQEQSIMSTYGHAIESNDDDYIKLASRTVTSVLSLGVQGLNAVDNLPFRKSLNTLRCVSAVH